jgi:hypothetical protein
MVSAILEVMAGTLGPSEAAAALGISAPKYYMVETRALEGMLAACEPRRPGYAHTPERELASLKKKYGKMERECARYQALARAAQRTVGLSTAKAKQGESKKGKRKRKPTVRALTLAKRLRIEQDDESQGVEGADKGTQEQHGG